MQKLNNIINNKDDAVPVPRKESSIKYGVSTSTIKLYETNLRVIYYSFEYSIRTIKFFLMVVPATGNSRS